MNNERLGLYLQLQKVKRTKSVVKLINAVSDDLRKDVQALTAQIIAIAQVTGYDAMRAGMALMEQEMKGGVM